MRRLALPAQTEFPDKPFRLVAKGTARRLGQPCIIKRGICVAVAVVSNAPA